MRVSSAFFSTGSPVHHCSCSMFSAVLSQLSPFSSYMCSVCLPVHHCLPASCPFPCLFHHYFPVSFPPFTYRFYHCFPAPCPPFTCPFHHCLPAPYPPFTCPDQQFTCSMSSTCPSHSSLWEQLPSVTSLYFSCYYFFHNYSSFAGNPGCLSWVTLQEPQGRRYPVLLTCVMFDCFMSQWGISIRFSKSAAKMSSMLLLVSPHSCRPVMCAANSLQVPCIASST